MAWTKITKEVDSGVTGTGFLNAPGFMAQGFLSSPTGSAWTKLTKPTDSWSKVTKPTDTWNTLSRAT